MFGSTFYHSLIRKYIILFGSLFNDIVVGRVDDENTTLQTMKLPISYGPKEKFLARLQGDPSLDRPFSMVLPRMAFELVRMDYDGDRKLQTIKKITHNDPSNKKFSVFNPVSYNFVFNLYIMVKNAEDGVRALEQILPFFTPQWTSTVNLIPEMNISHDIPIVLTQISSEDLYEGSFENRRSLVWTLQFVLKGYLYGPITEAGQIKKTIVNFKVPPSSTPIEPLADTPVSEHTDIWPGLDSDGNPTKDPQEAIPYNLVNETDDWDYIVEFINE